ncbi:Hypothetical protein HVR_LOCUS418 [uncultured virus]|nr:Hypothetical protein HVR_LOCUS418 [uncultured virus]
MDIIKLYDKDIAKVLQLSETRKGIPYEYCPYEMYNPTSADPWDRWETNKYLEELPSHLLYWQALKSFSYRLVKLQQGRQINPTYCRKSERNYQKYKEVHSKTFRFKYMGTKYSYTSL